MFLSQLVDKEIIVRKSPRGIVKGVGISLKTHKIKYLLCAESTASRAIFAISINTVIEFGEHIVLQSLRPVLAKHCACIFLQLPVYSFEGEYLGALEDVTMNDFIATTLRTDQNVTIPINDVAACSDALLLKKEQPYPIGQRIPAPFLSTITDKSDGVITRPILRAAIEKNTLIKLTLSLPPFSLEA